MVMKSEAQFQTGEPEVRTISAAEFKAKCLQLMDEVSEKKLTLIITKRGKPVMQAMAPGQTEEMFRPLWARTPNIEVPDDIKSLLDWPDPAIKWGGANKAGKRKKAK